MSLSTVLFLFLAHLGVGIAFTLVFVSREAGVKFFRFNSGLAAILLVIALAFAFNSLSAPTEIQPGSGGVAAVSIDRFVALSLVALVTSTALMVFYWATVGRILTKIRPAILALAAVTGLIAVALQGLSVGLPSQSWPMLVLTVASFLTSAAMLGGTCTAMILGHWYLVIPSLQVSHLQSIVRLHIASMLARIAVVAAAVWIAIATSNPDLGPSFRHYIMSVDGIFFWQRVLFGLAGPAVLSYLTWETAKIRSTQSATGILYVDFFTVVVGEVLAKYIVLATRVAV
jgi:protein NrfD